MTDDSRTPAGWYPAAHAGGEQRYWDGSRWLDTVPPPTNAGGQPHAFAAPPSAAPQPTGYPGGTSTLAPGAPQGYDSPPAAKKKLNVLGLIALIVAGIGFIFACVPGALIVGWILLPIAFVLAIVSFFMKGQGKALGIAGLIVSIVGTIVGVVVFFTVVSNAFTDAFDSGGSTVVTEPTTGTEEEAEDPAEEEQPAADAEGTRENPYPLGSTIENAEWRVVVNSVTLGATDAVLAASSFNEPPAAGSEYIVVNYSTTYLGSDPDGGIPAFVVLEYVTADGTTVNSFDTFVLPPEPAFDTTGTLYTDGTASGNVVFAVPSASAAEGVLAIQMGFVSDKVFVAVQ